MDIAVPSRFACLKIEDDDNRALTTKPKEVKKKKVVQKKPERDTKTSDKISAKKTSNNKQTVNSSSINKKDKKKPNTRQWEEWKQKDSEIVNGHFEEDLQNAILLSKLDYEHNKDLYKQLQEAAEREKVQAQNKKKKNKAMSLEQFLNSGGAKSNGSTDTNTKCEDDSTDDNFFKKVQLEAKKELDKEQVLEKRKKREANIDEIISVAQCQEKLEHQKAKNYVLQIQLDKAKAEITAVKGRNKTLCGILGHGEMKDKADVLLELEKLYIEKTELMEEVSRLHVLLEQERSKVAALTSESHNSKHKDKKRKQKGV